MPYMRAQPINNIFLSLTKPIQDTIKLGDLELYLDGSYRPEWNATVIGEIYGLPKNPKGDNAKVVTKLKNGDKVLFDYSVVAERKFESDGGSFTEITKNSPYYQKFTNGKGERLLIVAMPGKITYIWVGTLHDKRGNFVDGCQGSEHDIERWKSQFSFGETQKFFFKNLIDTGNKDVWKADYRDIYAKIVNDELETVGNRIILEPIDVSIPQDVIKQMGMVDTIDAKVRLGDRAKVLSAPEDTSIKIGDIVGFEPQYLEKYDYNNKQYYLIKSNRALGIWEENKNGL
jgi:co-chaperonin GroES (HSP10)